MRTKHHLRDDYDDLAASLAIDLGCVIDDAERTLRSWIYSLEDGRTIEVFEGATGKLVGIVHEVAADPVQRAA